MARIVNTASPGKVRNQARRTIAEMLRHLVYKREVDAETHDMVAAIVFALRNIEGTISATTDAWEKRNYFLKADRFRLEWEWVGPSARRLQQLIVDGEWDRLSEQLVQLAPRFTDIRIAKMTRKAETWIGSYQLLLSEADES